MRSIAITNQKGGTGKTTTAAAVAAGLREHGCRVLSVDLDAQGNLSFSMAGAPAPTVADLLQLALSSKGISTEAALQAVQHTPQGDLLASSPALSGADTILAEVTGREYKLREILQAVAGVYDYAIIDTPPTLGILTVNALTAADKVLAPAQAEVYSLIAIQQLAGTIDTVRKYCNPGLTFGGIVLTRYNGRAIISKDTAARMEQAARQYGAKLYAARIRECTALKECETLQRSIFEYAPRSNAAADYSALVREIIEEEE